MHCAAVETVANFGNDRGSREILKLVSHLLLEKTNTKTLTASRLRHLMLHWNYAFVTSTKQTFAIIYIFLYRPSFSNRPAARKSNACCRIWNKGLQVTNVRYVTIKQRQPGITRNSVFQDKHFGDLILRFT